MIETAVILAGIFLLLLQKFLHTKEFRKNWVFNLAQLCSSFLLHMNITECWSVQAQQTS